MSAAHPQTPDPAPWIRDSPHFRGLLAHIGGRPGARKAVGHEIARCWATSASSMVIGPLPHRVRPVRQAFRPASFGKPSPMFRRFFVYLFVAWAGMASLAAAARAEPVFPPGLRIGLEPPGDMKLTTQFPGFEDSERKAVIAILDLPASAYRELENAAFANTQRDLQQAKARELPVRQRHRLPDQRGRPAKRHHIASVVLAGTSSRGRRPRSHNADKCGGARKRAADLFRRNNS